MKPSLLLTSPRRWTKFTFARKLDNEPVGVFHPSAASWDLCGAIARYTGLPTAQAEYRILQTEVWRIWCVDNARAECHCQQTLVDFNDTTQFEWVALALAQANL